MIVLETERLLFRDHAIDDLEPFCAMEADSEFRRFVGGSPRSHEDAEEKFRRVYLPPVRDRIGLWATVFKPEGRYIGYCGVYRHGGHPGEGVIAYYLARPYWGRGLGGEAAAAFVRFAFDDLGLRRLVTSVEAGNERSTRILAKLGFVWVRRENGDPRTFDHFELVNPSFGS
jgi:RimJ/RimL family protein N-acetyltransferase